MWSSVLRLPLILSFLLVLLAQLPTRSFGQSFTLSQALSAPFNSGLIASPKGARFAWIANEQGRRNIWVSEPNPKGSYTSHPISRYQIDDGLELSGLTWNGDGESVLYVRGGDAEFEERPAPNPAMLPGVVEQEIWKVGVHGGDPVKLAAGHHPAVSSDGSTLAYLLKEQVWTLALNDPTAKPLQLFHGRGSFRELVWSPDSQSLAFVSNRGDHGFVGVFTLRTKALSYLDASTAHDEHPAWSPDSSELAYIRVFPDAMGVAFKPRRTAEPWSIRVARRDGSEAREMWHSTPGPGSVFHESVGSSQLLWSADNQIAFPWERDGWLHLYAVPGSGGKAVLLTPGDFEVESVLLSPDRRRIIYSSNQNDIDRRHLWSVSLNGGAPVQMTRGLGSEVSAALGDDSKTCVVLRSDAILPGRPALMRGDGDLEDIAPQMIPADFPGKRFVVPEQVIFRATDGMQIHGQLFLPASIGDKKRHPAIVFFHGGSRRQMLLGWHYMQYYHNTYAMNEYLASLGYIVLSVNYRSGIGYGLNFREALEYGAGGASEFRDVQGAGLYLAGREDVDPHRIGVWGGSYGGYLTALALARSSDLFAAGVDLHGVHDWKSEQANWGPSDPRSDQQTERIAFESSPLYSVKAWRSPVLLMQGDDDRNVPFNQTVRLAAALREQGVDFEEHIFPDEVHDFLLHRSWLKAYTLAAEFFQRKLSQSGTESRTHSSIP